MEFMRKFIKKPITWIAVLALVLVSTLAVRGFSNAGTAAEPTQTDGAQNATVSMDAADVADTATGNAGVSTVDVEDDEGGAADGAVGDLEEDDPSALIPSAGTPTINEKLTWEAINSFPIKTRGMSIDDARQLCVDFLRFSKTALWTPKESITFIKNGSGSVDTMSEGIVYGGLPYVGVASGSVYRMMDWMDESTGVMDISKALTDDASLSSGTISMGQLKYFGNQCSIGAYWGWARVMNSAKYRWTQDAVPKNNFIMLGDYTAYASDGLDSISAWTYSATKSYVNTVMVCTAVGEQQMYENYAQLQKGDGMVQYTTAGHIVMVATDAVVTRLEDGTIDGANSYVTVLDQAQKWQDGENAAGDNFRYKNNVDAKWSFQTIYKGNYIPFTFGELIGTDPIEETEVAFSLKGNTITKSQLFSSQVTANYGISDVYIILTDDTGTEVYRHVVRSSQAGKMALDVVESGDNVDTYGSLSSGTYNIEIAVQLGTGERPTVYVGTLIA